MFRWLPARWQYPTAWKPIDGKANSMRRLIARSGHPTRTVSGLGDDITVWTSVWQLANGRIEVGDNAVRLEVARDRGITGISTAAARELAAHLIAVADEVDELRG